ncbi:hypothetical protein [Candidatus Bacteroides intestinigallinarum]|jgi:hypothetical protein|uniref:hypothetical protein n=1 Tax=Candidatus Bacteroides intestinigallinarum TaxID=2838470 RepID=UPI0020535D6A|nr:hypothetical protein [Candidatus Bacteroides intestinigallinarum]MCS3200209.1 hypothetical protein [Candidatus Bacteroides intestinigallinarum]DAS85430.1 MAG TPA: hypothetical protein [Caudoviricetes sp.]
MKKLLLGLVSLFCSFYASAQNEILTNQAIIDMLELGFTEDIIVTKISTSKCDFNTEIDALKSLKEKGVNSNIIVSMIKAAKSIQENEEYANDAVSGIFIKEGEKMVRIHPTIFSGTKTNTLGSALSYGIADAKIKSTMLGTTSNNIVNTTLPEFYFLFERNRNNISLSDWWFSVATSPNQFALVKLETKGKRRELETGKVNIYAGTSVGVNEENIIKFRITEINDYEYKVVPESPLKPGGEYCFFYQGSIPQGGYNNQAVFDFSISKTCKRSNAYPVGSYVFVFIENKIKKCLIKDVNVENGEIYYTGETSTFKKAKWRESSCSLDKEELKATILGQIDDVQCRVIKKYNNGMTICISKELTPDQIKKAKDAFSLKGKIMFNLEGAEGKGEAYAGIDDGFIIIYKSNEFIKL